MHQTRISVQLLLALGLGAILIACGQSTSPSVGSGAPPPGGANPTTAPNTVALACNDNRVAEYKPNSPDRDVQISWTSEFAHVDYFIESVTYDSFGNLYVGYLEANRSTAKWGVDDFAAGRSGPLTSRDAIRHIHDLFHITAMTTDPDGNLYVAEAGDTHEFVMFKPKEEKPAIRVTDFSDPTDLVFAKGHLWVADNGKSEVKAYHIYPESNRAVFAWLLDTHDGMDGPITLAEADSHAAGEDNGNLYILNVPTVGDDYVKEYAIWSDRAPRFARTLPGPGVARLHYITTITTDTDENVYLFEVPLLAADDDWISIYNRNGAFVYRIRFHDYDRTLPYTLVATPDRLYKGHGHQLQTYIQHGLPSFALDLAPGCAHAKKLALMGPPR